MKITSAVNYFRLFLEHTSGTTPASCQYTYPIGFLCASLNKSVSYEYS